MGKKYSNRMGMSGWVSLFLEFIVSKDLQEEIAEQLLLHLADLGALTLIDENIWQWKSCDSTLDSEKLISLIKNDLEILNDTEPGFALAYFIGYKNFDRKNFSKIDKHKNIDSTTLGKPVSNLSNLQIVKKVGKQLQPFLQIEESVISRLVGKYVDNEGAKKLFHYMFSKVGAKAEPRAWQQLSRKRHR